MQLIIQPRSKSIFRLIGPSCRQYGGINFKKKIQMLVTALFLSLLSSTFALPSGAPVCDVSPTELSGPHGKASTIANPLVVTVEKDLKASIKISGKFQGLLIWVDKQQFTREFPTPGKYDHHGNFADLPDGFKYVDCNKAFPHSTVTHSGPEHKNTIKDASTTLTWKVEAPKTITHYSSSYIVRAAVLKDEKTWAKFDLKFDFTNLNSKYPTKNNYPAEKETDHHAANVAGNAAEPASDEEPTDHGHYEKKTTKKTPK